MENLAVHPNFKINGKHVPFEDITEIAYSFIKEGEPYEESIGNFLLDWVDATKSIVVKTSGSTGKPKPIKLLKNHMRNSALATGEFFGLLPGNTSLLCLSCDYIAGKMMLVRAMVLGLDIYLTEPKSNPLERFKNNQDFDFCAMVPLQVQALLDQMQKVKKLIIGGAPLSSRLKKDLVHTNTEIYETYGMTETITHIAIKHIGKGAENNNFKALPGVIFTIDDRGCLIICAPKISIEKVITNDVVELISETEFIWLGRYDHVVNSGGVKLFPEVIESKLNEVIDRPYFVAGIEDEVLGQKLILIIETDGSNEYELLQFNSIKSLEPYERPKDIFYLEHFIRTDSGKVHRDFTLKRAMNNT